MSKNKAIKANVGRNEAFAIATITQHAAAARKPKVKTRYDRKDKSWRKEQ